MNFRCQIENQVSDYRLLGAYLMWKPIPLFNLIYKVFVSDGKTGHLRKVCNNMHTNIFL
jgi:hypothetical protein